MTFTLLMAGPALAEAGEPICQRPLDLRVSARALDGSLEGSVGADDDGEITEIGAISAEATWSRCALDAADDPVLGGG